MDNSKEFTVVEFCAGYGGIHLGLSRAIPNLRLIAASEIEAFAVANLVAKMEAGLLDSAPVWPDLKTFPNSEFHGLVDLLVAGFPCQPFSAAGKRGGSDDPRHLFPYIKQSLIDMRPRYVFLENVEGIISSKLGEGWDDSKGTPVLLHVLRELERVGYRATAGVFSAAEVGAPHQRKRVFILGVADDPKRENIFRIREELEKEESNQRSSNAAAWPSSSDELADQQQQGLEGQSRNEQGEGWSGTWANRPVAESSLPLWPSRPGEPQHEWEPPRVVGNDQKLHSSSSKDNREGSRESPYEISEFGNSNGYKGWGNSGSEVELPVGRDADGPADRLDDAELYESCDNRVDELRLLGNGVVPATAERAWRILYNRLHGGVG